MPINAAALALIKEREGFVAHWYPDPAHGWDVPTCCWGHTDAAGKPLFKDDPKRQFTKAEGEAILQSDLEPVIASVKRLVKVPLNENQLGALVSFTYNLGAASLERSTLLKLLNANDYAAAADQFRVWNKARNQSTGKLEVMPGLVTRRAAEKALFLTPVGGSIPAPVPTPAPTPEPPRREPVPDERTNFFAFLWGLALDLIRLIFNRK